MAPSDSQDDYSSETLLTLVQAVALQVQELTTQVQQISGASGSSLTTNNYLRGVTLLDPPVTVVTGTTTAYTSTQTTDISSSVPSSAKGVIIQSFIKVTVGGGGMKSWVVTPGGTVVPVQVALSGANAGWSYGVVTVPISGQQLKWRVTDESGGSTTTNWAAYSFTVLGYTS